ncbi:unnamed protein product [Adineta steineri]|uniref:Interferon-induced transmembrane protein n=1 Tax=Adineta steineri TaxID=433720 RepID=A0A815EL22_9BILA|nr:unnamed protein product [Adineta steineri]CAF1311463.1 unnamed protein product [Adineta steineri]
MDFSPEKKWPNETPSSSAILIDGPNYLKQNPGRIRHHFLFSLFSVICLCPATGLIALAYSLKSSAKADVNFHDKARLYSRRALFWNIVSCVLAVLSIFAVLVYFYQLNAMFQLYANQLNPQMQTSDVDNTIRSIANY